MIKKYIFIFLFILTINACLSSEVKVVEGIEKKTRKATYTEKLYGKEEITFFSTPYGNIEKGQTMAAIMHLLGNPYRIVSEGDNEIWYYDFGDNENLFIYFLRDKVIDVKDEQKSNM